MILDNTKGLRNLAAVVMMERIMMDMKWPDAKPKPFILFLGADVARASEEMARKWFEDLGKRDPETAKKYPSNHDPVQTFYESLGEMSNTAQYNVLQGLSSRLPIPRSYQGLARLLRYGYLTHVLTTNIDTLLEEALNGIGLRRADDYQVIMLGRREAPERPPDSPADDDVIKVIKVHSDLGRDQVTVTGAEISDTLDPRRQYRSEERKLEAHIVIVGGNIESELVNSWLRETSGKLWWVSPQKLERNQILSKTGRRRGVTRIYGRITDPSETEHSDFFAEFFGLLSLFLGELSTLVLMTEDSGATLREKELRDALPAKKGLEAAYLQDQLWRSQAALSSLDLEKVAIGEGDVRLQVQIDYERGQIAQLEDRVLELESKPSELDKLMNEVIETVGRVDPRVKTFLTKLRKIVLVESKQDQPDQDTIGAAIDAMVLVSNRLDVQGEVRESVDKLESIAPSAMRRD